MKNFMALCILLVLVYLPFSGHILGQTVVLEEDRQDEIDGDEKKFGPNRAHYVHQFISLGFIIPSDGQSVHFGRSLHFDYGIRYKLKLFEHLALGAEVTYSSLDFHLKPGVIQWDKEKLTFYNVGGGAYLRINFDKRGDIIGKYVDVGGSYNYIFNSSYFRKVELTNGEIDKRKLNKLEIANKYFYDALVRVGYNQVSLYARYRMAPLLKETPAFTSLPIFVIGLQFGLN